jgi:urease accessory protein
MLRALPRLCVVALAFVPAAAWAHPGIPGHVHGFASGFGHPLSGADHVLAMFAVGLFAARLGGRALWLVPLTFVSVMALAGVAGMNASPVAFVGIGIGISIVALGLLIAVQKKVPTLAAMILAGFFAIFHGYAHGAEMPANLSGIAYGLGFVCATAVLHALGIGFSRAISKAGEMQVGRLVRFSGAAVTAVGLAILVLPQ